MQNKKQNLLKIFNIYNILSIFLTIGIFTIYKLSRSNDEYAMKIFFINKDYLSKIFSYNILVVISIFLIFLAFIEFYSMKYFKDKKLRNSFFGNLFIKGITIYLMLFFKMRIFIFNFLIVYLLCMNLIYFLEFLQEVKTKKRVKLS